MKWNAFRQITCQTARVSKESDGKKLSRHSRDICTEWKSLSHDKINCLYALQRDGKCELFHELRPYSLEAVLHPLCERYGMDAGRY